MAIVLQEVCGSAYGTHFYPSFSGVARSLNYYPIGHETAEEGIANVALGLGKYIVDGGLSLRFSPAHPKSCLQANSLEIALRETQNHFYAFDLAQEHFTPQVDDGFNLLKLTLKDAEKDDSLQWLASTFNPQAQALYDSLFENGRRVITFANILKHDTFPLAAILQKVLQTGQREMGRPVEIEFAVELDRKSKSGTFYLLQIRPIVDSTEMLEEDLDEISNGETIINCTNALGHGRKEPLIINLFQLLLVMVILKSVRLLIPKILPFRGVPVVLMTSIFWDRR